MVFIALHMYSPRWHVRLEYLLLFIYFFSKTFTFESVSVVHTFIGYLRNNFSLPVNYCCLTHVIGGQITKY